MIRGIKILGFPVLTVLAMSAVIVSPAQAQKGILTTGLTPETHTGSTVHVIPEGGLAENYVEANGVKLSCNPAGVTGTVSAVESAQTSGTDKTVTITGDFGSECGTLNAEGKITSFNATIFENGCDTRVNQPTKIGPEEYRGSGDLVCPGGSAPRIVLYANAAHTIKLCEVEVEPNQEGVEEVTFRNIDNGEETDEITVEGIASGLKYTNLSSTCPGGKGTFENGVAVGKGIATSTEGHDIWISDEEE